MDGFPFAHKHKLTFHHFPFSFYFFPSSANRASIASASISTALYFLKTKVKWNDFVIHVNTCIFYLINGGLQIRARLLKTLVFNDKSQILVILEKAQRRANERNVFRLQDVRQRLEQQSLNLFHILSHLVQGLLLLRRLSSSQSIAKAATPNQRKLLQSLAQKPLKKMRQKKSFPCEFTCLQEAIHESALAWCPQRNKAL